MWLFDKRKLHNIEYILLIIVTVIALFGLLAILMATADPATGGEEATLFETLSRLNFTTIKWQLIWIFVGFVAMAAVAWLDYHIYARIWYVVGIVCLGLIVFTSFKGAEHGGTRGWIDIPLGGSKFMSFQPTEIGKLGLILLLAKTISAKENLNSFKDLLWTFGVMLAFTGALLTQMDIGTSLVYVFIFIVMLFAGGIKWQHLLLIFGAGALACVALWFLMGEKQQSRILNFLSGEEVDQLRYAKIAIGSGGWTGKGVLGENSISQNGFIFAISTDFIFAAIGESLGFFGGLALILIYVGMEVRMWYLMTHKAYDRFGAMIIVGVMALFMFHIFENIGMVIGIMPITGIPLPFISYGGSNFLTNMIAIGLVESVCINRPIEPFSEV
ncbi:MAG: FtsW/RodA/SpoVE family cell cycle protein [Clostridia bacterium]|nr:FtsW/RodA/SpoVE family cell cycle protein [Clostridia bacterium]